MKEKEGPRFELLDQQGQVLAYAPLTADVLLEADQDGTLKEILIDCVAIRRGKATNWRSVNATDDVVMGPIIEISPQDVIGAPLYLKKTDIRSGDRLSGKFQVLTIKE